MKYKLFVHFETKVVEASFESVEARNEAEEELYDFKQEGMSRYCLDDNISISCDKFLYTAHN